MTLKIGIPRALAYYAYGELWESYFKNLGCEVIVSPYTNKAIVDDGTRETVGEACIPIKIYHGHVMWLAEKVDYLFIPRLINIDIECKITFCPKFLGLPDLLKVSLPNLPNVISPNVALHGKKSRLMKLGIEIAQQLGRGALLGVISMYKALKEKKLPEVQQGKKGLNFALVGYPYFLHDDFLNFKIHDKLTAAGINVVYSSEVSKTQSSKYKKNMSKSLFWEFSNRALLATYYLLEDVKIDALIHLTAFSCGPDAMLGKLIELECKERGIPFLELTIDEHTGEAGIQTRIEAFIDMLALRRKGA